MKMMIYDSMPYLLGVTLYALTKQLSALSTQEINCELTFLNKFI